MKTGEVIKLGNHRLACGNCHDEELVEKLIGKDKIRMICSDPPYGVKYVEGKDWLGMRGRIFISSTK